MVALLHDGPIYVNSTDASQRQPPEHWEEHRRADTRGRSKRREGEQQDNWILKGRLTADQFRIFAAPLGLGLVAESAFYISGEE